ncbi:unnamed protein product [Durusdinium trenchii]|uniref:Glycosyltransferase 2-like domain-containing protein n=1 Tax=Durusdinium trenchii TaxID=1381693 RepID=A0ABP0Q5N1_9DINO
MAIRRANDIDAIRRRRLGWFCWCCVLSLKFHGSKEFITLRSLQFRTRPGANRPRCLLERRQKSLGSLPSVSVQIVTYNRTCLVLEALQQIEAQDYAGEIEVLVLDDSPHSSLRAVEGFANTSRHRVVYHFLEKRLTIGAKRNLAVSLSLADLVCTWDDDDIYTEDRVRLQVEFLLEHPRCKCAMMERRYFFWSSYGVLRSCRDELQLFPLENTLCFWRSWFQARSFDAGNLNEGLGLLRGAQGVKHPGRLGILSIPAEDLPFVYVKHEGSMTGSQILPQPAEDPVNVRQQGVGLGGWPLLPLARAFLMDRFPALPASSWCAKGLGTVRKLLCEEIKQDIKQLRALSDRAQVASYIRQLGMESAPRFTTEGLLGWIDAMEQKLRMGFVDEKERLNSAWSCASAMAQIAKEWMGQPLCVCA